MDSRESFYADLPFLRYPDGLEQGQSLVDLPENWGIGLTDVVGSTRALSEGRYKEVNQVGAATIMAVLNVGGFQRIPYVFGGDGSLFAFPWSMADKVREVLEATQLMAKESFGLKLRAGLVPVEVIRAQGGVLRLGKVAMSSAVGQAVFWGNGWDLADIWLKAKEPPEGFDVLQPRRSPGNPFQGLECRWHQIPSRKEEVVVMIVRAMVEAEEERAAIYGKVWREIEAIYGPPEEAHPVDPNLMRLSLRQRELRGEWKIRSFNTSRLYRFWYFFQVRLLTMIGAFLMHKAPRPDAPGWTRYKCVAAGQTDFRKFDNQIRQVLAGTVAQRARLTAFLDTLADEGKILFGLHSSPGTFMTCLISDHQQHHVHLVDGTEGGYALAAKQMKARKGKKVVHPD